VKFDLKYWLLGSSIVAAITFLAVFGIASFQKVNSLASLTNKLYQHPLTVSNAVLAANANVIAMHRHMKDVVLARNVEDLETAISKVNVNEKEVYRHFSVVTDRFLGNKNTVVRAREAFSDWKVIRSEVIQLTRNAMYDEAAAITKGKGAIHVALLTKRMDSLIKFARNKATEFLEESKQELERGRTFLFSMFVVLVVSILVITSLAYLLFINAQKRNREGDIANELIRNSEEKNRLILNSAGEGIYGLDLNGNTTFVNPKVCELLGFTNEELIGQPMHSLIHHSYADGTVYPREKCPMYGTLADGQSHHITDEVLWRKDGTCFPIEYISVPIHKDGDLFGAVVTFRDITEQIRADSQLRKARDELEIKVEDRTKELVAELELRKAAELKSELERERLEDAVFSFKDGFALFDSDDRLVIWNDQFIDNDQLEDVLKPGITFEQFMRARIPMTNYKDRSMRDENRIQERLEQHRNPSGPHDYEFADGRNVQIHEFRTNNGGTAILRIDVTEQKKSEQQLRQSQEQLSNAVESLEEGFAYFDANDRLVTCNNKFRGMRPGNEGLIKPGITFEEILRIPVKEEGEYDDQVRDEAWIMTRMEHHRNPKGALYRTLNSGPTIQINQIKSNDGGTVHVHTDITELIVAENNIREYSEKLDLILHSMAEGVATINTDGTIDYVNPVVEKMFGYTSKELIGSNVSMLMPEPYHSEHDGYLSNYLASTKNKILGKYREVVGKRKDGSIFPMNLTTNKYFADGEIKFVGTVHDLSDRKQTEMELKDAKVKAEAANQTKTDFLANMSHELRTPMNAILGFGQLLSHLPDEKLSGKQNEYVDHILESGNHLLNLINDILDISAIEAGKLELHVEEVEIGPLIGEMLTLVKTRADDGNVKLSAKIAEDAATIWTDDRRLKQILINLLSNAVKFTPVGGEVTVRCKSDRNNQISFVVSDTGIGMTKKEIQKALETFGQVDSSVARKQQGTGLGLPLVKHLVEALGGSFKINSRKNIGTTITFKFFFDLLLKNPPKLPGQISEPSNLIH
jgi:PAS domain S-box-containing protein